MRFLHTSDWHLGAMDGNYSMLEDQRFFIDRIADLCEKEKIDVLLLAGDVYDRSVSSAEAIALYDYAMSLLCLEKKVKVITIAGNHDSAERLSSCSSLLKGAGLYIEGSLSLPFEKVEFEDAEVYLLPWITEEKVKSVFPEKKAQINDLPEAYLTVTKAMKETFTEGKKHLILSHAFITNAETSTSDRAAVIGFASQVPASVFDGFDYVALGHIHKPQKINDSVYYSGTPMPYSFGSEENQEKRVLIVDTKDMSIESMALPLLHQRVTLTGTLEELLHPNCPEEVKNGYVRLQVTDSFVGLNALSDLRSVYPHILDVSGKVYESDNASVTMTLEKFEEMETDPMEIFKYFCMEEMGGEASEHILTLFEEAMQEDER